MVNAIDENCNLDDVETDTPNYGALSGRDDATSIKDKAHASSPKPMTPRGMTWPAGRRNAVYAIVLLTLLNAANKLDRFVLIEVIKDMAAGLEFGERSCLNSSVAIGPYDVSDEQREKYACDPARCDESQFIFLNNTHTTVDDRACHWEYWGTGIAYQLLAGPAFIVVVGLMRIPLTVAMERGRVNGRNVIAVCAVAWSASTLVTGFATRMWHVAVCRVFLGFFQAPFSPFSIALITVYFPPQLRGMAMSILNCGVGIGYGLSYALGFIREFAGWRWAYWTASVPGVVLATMLMLILPNPASLIQKHSSQSLGKLRRRELLAFLNWVAIVPLCLGSALRFGATYICNYNINNYLLHYYPEFHVYHYMSWTSVLTGIGGVFFGGIISDIARRRYGVEGRVVVQIAISVIAIPIMTLVFFLEPPNVFAAMTIGLAFSDAWPGATMSALSELVPSVLRPSFFAVFYCTINIVGGTLNMALPTLRHAIGFRYAMITAVIGLIALGTVFFALGLVALLCTKRPTFRVSTESEYKDEKKGNEEAPLIG